MSTRSRLAAAPAYVRVLAVLAGVGAVCSLLAAAFGFPGIATPLVTLLTGLADLLAVALVVAFPHRVTVRVAHALLLLSTGQVTLVVLVSPTYAGALLAAYYFSCLAWYAGYFFSRTSARLHTLAMSAGLGAGLLAGRQEALATAPPQLLGWVTCTAVVVAVQEMSGQLADQLRRHASTDPLTHLPNRRGLLAAATRALSVADRTRLRMTAAVIDLDGFKHVNDRLGHGAGDRLLVEATRAWTRGLRAGDQLARLGGDEFVLLMPATALDEARTVVDRLRAAHPCPWSAGLASSEPGDTLDTLLMRADTDLYVDKERRAGLRGEAQVMAAMEAAGIRAE